MERGREPGREPGRASAVSLGSGIKSDGKEQRDLPRKESPEAGESIPRAPPHTHPSMQLRNQEVWAGYALWWIRVRGPGRGGSHAASCSEALPSGARTAFAQRVPPLRPRDRPPHCAASSIERCGLRGRTRARLPRASAEYPIAWRTGSVRRAERRYPAQHERGCG